MRGSVLVFSLLVLALLLSAALSGAAIVLLGKNSSKSTVKSTLAFQVADGGAENVLRRIYHENDANLNTLANNLSGSSIAGGGNPTCLSGVISGKLPNSQGVFQVAFYDGTGTKLTCSGAAHDTYAEWRTALTRIVSTGSFAGSTRAVDVAITPAPCGGIATVDYGGDTYDAVEIGNQCWMKQNMRVGARIDAPTPQTDDGTIQKYCYNNQDSNCTSNHPNEPDGGLYTWDEAMQYDSTEGGQGICPTGWHVPTDNDWYVLENSLKDTGQTCNASRSNAWDCNTAGTKLITPAGITGFDGNFSGVYTVGFSFRNTLGFFWTSSKPVGNPPWWRALADAPQTGVFRDSNGNTNTVGLSIRCLKD